MNSKVVELLNRLGDLVSLTPQIVGRFYPDGNRLGQRSADAPRPAFYQPERWIGSCTRAANPPGIPAAGQSACPQLGDLLLKDLLADPQVGPRLLGEKRYVRHNGALRLLLKLLDAYHPIFFHVHADDAFVQSHRRVYPDEQFGKDEAYHYLDLPVGRCPYTHIGLYPGVTMKDLMKAMKAGDEHILALSPVGYQAIGEGYFVKAGMLHRPGTAVTLEVQQPSDVYTIFQNNMGGEPIDRAVRHPGFAGIEQAARQVVRWDDNVRPKIVEKSHLKPQRADGFTQRGGKVEWVFPPRVTKKFSGVRATVDTRMKLRFDDPAILFVWRGRGTINRTAVRGGGGPVGQNDEFFVGVEAGRRGLEIVNTGDEPLVVFAVFPQRV